MPIYTRLKGPEIDYVLRHSETVCYVGQPDLHSLLAQGCPAIGRVKLVYLTGDAPAEPMRSFADLLASSGSPAPLPMMNEDDTAAILYTSGTTAQPKGVTHSHAGFLATAAVMHSLGMGHDQVVVVLTSMAHMIGIGMTFLPCLVNGATMVITRPFDFESVLRAYEQWRCTYAMGTPVMFDGLLRAYLASPRDVSSARFFICGGDSVSTTLQEAFRAHIGVVCEGYGGTEMAPSAAIRPDDVRTGSIGRPVMGTKFRLLDADGNEVKPGEVGEICAQGRHLMTGYWQDPEATATAMRGGWFHTGDLARCDADGFYWFAGRTKEIIVRGGSNISPQEVEAVLYQHPAVAEAGVVGQPDDRWGEIVIAFVCLRPGWVVSEAELIAFARERLADYKTPERISFLTELPKGITGKILRRALRPDAAVVL